ncbi:MAG: Fic family protein [Dehalococcoidales bacterium]
MYVPKYTMTPEIDENLEEIERLKYRIERQLIMPKHEEWLRRESFMRTAYSSTMVENATITEEEMEKAIKPSPSAKIPKERVDVANYARALNFVDYLSDIPDAGIPVLNEGTIMQIHWQLMSGIHDTHLQPGKYRTEPNWIVDQGIRVYEPPSHIDVPILMREFSEWLMGNDQISPVIRAGIGHLHLVAIHPFVDGNGRTARLLATLLLQKSGYGFRKLLSLDAYYQRSRDGYINALQSSLEKSYHPGYESTEWLDFFTESIVLQSQTLERRLTDWRRAVEIVHEGFKNTGLNERQIDGFVYASRVGFLTRKYYAEIANVSLITASRDIAEMVKAGLLKPEGKARNLKYTLIPKRANE